jgi:hypothetical protein
MTKLLGSYALAYLLRLPVVMCGGSGGILGSVRTSSTQGRSAHRDLVCHSGPLVAIHLINLNAWRMVTLAWREWRRGGRRLPAERAPEGSQCFLGCSGWMLGELFGLVVVAQTICAFFFGRQSGWRAAPAGPF